MNRKNIFLSFLLLIPVATTIAQNLDTTITFTVIRNMDTYLTTVRNNPNKKMMDIKPLKNIILNLKYASAENFMHEKLYSNAHSTYLRKRTFDAIKKVQEQLKSKGLILEIWDAYRPFAVTEKMWDKIRDERYVANPKSGSGHNRGIAVDVTLIDGTSRKELDMGTGFDNFTDSAHVDFINLPTQILNNRKLLKDIMEKNGFINLNTEWWHFSIPNIDEDEVLDLSFRQLKKIAAKNY